MDLAVQAECYRPCPSFAGVHRSYHNIYHVIVLLAATKELMAQVYSNCRCQRQISGSDAQARSFEALVFSCEYKRIIKATKATHYRQ